MKFTISLCDKARKRERVSDVAATWPKTITYPLNQDDLKVLDLIHQNNPHTVKNGVEAIRHALQDYESRHGSKPNGERGNDPELATIRQRLEGASTAELKALLLEILLEVREIARK